MEKKYKNLSRNVILFSISSFGQKFLAFFLIPLYTGFLTTEQYGTIDLITTTVNLLLPVLTLNVAEAVMRFTIEYKGSDDYVIFGIGTVIKGSCLLAIFVALLSYVPELQDLKPYFVYLVLVFTGNAIYSLMQNYLRAMDKIQLMVVASLVNSVIMLVLDIVLIAKLHMGISGYYISMISGLAVAILVMEFGSSFHKHLDFHSPVSQKVRRECLCYSIPTVFTALAWWVNSSLDKYFVTAFCGFSANGIYSVSYKIPTILGMFQNIFTQAWTLSAIKEFDPEDKEGFFGKTYNIYNSMMVLITSLIMFVNIPLSRILYANEFYVASEYVPMLLVSSLFSAMAGYLGSIFSAVMDTKTCAYSTIASAIVNIILNTILIPQYGIRGAAIATVIAYIVAWGIRIVVSRRYIHMKISIKKDLLVYSLLLVQSVFATHGGRLYVLQLILIGTILIVYFSNYKAAVFQFIERYIRRK